MTRAGRRIWSAAGAGLLLWAAAAGAGDPGAGPDESAAAAMARWSRLTEADGGRAPGQPGNRALEEAVARAFAASGFTNGTLRFEAPVFRPGRTAVRLDDGATLTLLPMHPALLRPGNFDAAEFEAPLVYLGRGGDADIERLRGRDLDGAVAVMEFDCGDRWMEALRFGVRGFVFLAAETYSPFDAVAKVYNSEVAVPRFFAPEPAAAALRRRLADGGVARGVVTSAPSAMETGLLGCPWVLIPGAGADFDRDVILITAPLDANSVVPELATGGESAGNLMVLLDLLERWRRQPPQRPVLLVAVNAHTAGYLGERMLAWHLLQPADDVARIHELLEREMRIASVFVDHYSRLRLDPAPLPAPQLRDALNLLGALYGPEPAGDVTALDAGALQQGVDKAVRVLDDRLGGLAARLFMSDADRRELREDRRRLAALRSADPAALREVLGKALSAFGDEQRFDDWVSAMDSRSGVRVAVKAELQEAVQRELNVVKLDEMELAREADRHARELAALRARREALTRLLVLFNKINLGFGRRGVRYRDIAADEASRVALAGFRDRVLGELTARRQRFEEMLQRDVDNGALRKALGLRRVRLGIALGLNASADRVGLMPVNSTSRPEWYRRLGDLAAGVAGATEAAPGGVRPYVDTLSSAVDLPQQDFFGEPNTPAGLYHTSGGVPCLMLRSPFSLPSRAFTPGDRLAGLDAESVQARHRWACAFLAGLVDAPGLTTAEVCPELPPVPANLRLWSVLVRTFEMDEFAAKPTPSLPVRRTVIAAYSAAAGTETVPSVVDGQVANVCAALGDDTGHAVLYGLWESPLAPTAYRLDDERRARVTATIDRGRVQRSQQIDSNLFRAPTKTLPMFRAAEFMIRDRNDVSLTGGRAIQVQKVWPISGATRSEPQKFGTHGLGSRSTAVSHRASGPGAVYQEYRPRRGTGEPLILLTENRRFAVNPSAAAPEGAGFAVPAEMDKDFFRQAAHDMDAVSRHRVGQMRGIVNELADEFLARGREALAAADEALRGRDYTAYRRAAALALGNEVKAYGQIRSMNADMLKAIIIYMALMLPFCYFLQKLVFSFTRVEHEMMAFAVLFVATYTGFRLIHPAFSIAMSPEAIFLSFVLGTIGCFVTWILHSRFSAEMDLLFRGASGLAGEASQGFVGQTAMIIGVNNMKRRRIRTSLTTATVVLVVFTMLAFSSVSRKARPILIRQPGEAPYTGLLYTWPGRGPMDEGTAQAFEALYAGRAEVLVRRALRPPAAAAGVTVRWRIERADDPSRWAGVTAALGLSPRETRFAGALPFESGRGFSGDGAAEIVLPATLADALDIADSDAGRARVRWLGRTLTVTGILDDDRYRMLRDLDPRMPLLPGGVGVDADLEQAAAPGAETGTGTGRDLSAVIFLPPGLCRDLGGRPYSISVCLGEKGAGGSAAVWDEADALLRMSGATFILGSTGEFRMGGDARRANEAGVYQVSGAYRTTIGGLSRLLIPLLLAGLILFNTMLGTVYERKAEIAIYNAIGLNPRHIFIFFLAEALVYGVIGAIGGYLIGQILTMTAQHFHLIRGMNVNFSSLMVVWAILFTIGLTLLSTLYPAHVATRTAVPSGARRWGLPKHDGQRIQMDLPFIYEPDLAIGVMAYLHETLSACVEGTLNDMLVEVRSLTSAVEDGHPVLRAEFGVALAPYDLGVTQSLRVESRFLARLDSYDLRLDIRRESGQDTSWVTVNRPMLERLRRTLLRWRNMEPARHQEYVGMGRKLFGV